MLRSTAHLARLFAKVGESLLTSQSFVPRDSEVFDPGKTLRRLHSLSNAILMFQPSIDPVHRNCAVAIKVTTATEFQSYFTLFASQWILHRHSYSSAAYFATTFISCLTLKIRCMWCYRVTLCWSFKQTVDLTTGLFSNMTMRNKLWHQNTSTTLQSNKQNKLLWLRAWHVHYTHFSVTNTWKHSRYDFIHITAREVRQL